MINGFSNVKIDKWSKESTGNTSIWKSLNNAGYSNKEIIEKNLVEQVAKENNLKDPNAIKEGQEIKLPVKMKEMTSTPPGPSNPSKSTQVTNNQSNISSGITGEKLANNGDKDKTSDFRKTSTKNDKGGKVTDGGNKSIKLPGTGAMGMMGMMGLGSGSVGAGAVISGGKGAIKSGNIPAFKPEKELTPGEVSKELETRRRSLDKLGVKWSDSKNIINDKEEIKMMKDLEGIALKLPPQKRPNMTLNFSEKDPRGKESLGRYHSRENHLDIFKDDQTTSDMQYTITHEYGHAVADKLNDKSGVTGKIQEFREKNTLGGIHTTPYANVTDSRGRYIQDRADDLEANAKKKGLNPGTQFDPYVESGVYIEGKKYASANREEHFAETFAAYTRHPERFKSKMNDMKNYLDTNKPGTDKYKYVQESYKIMQDSYNYFKGNVFAGQEFGGKFPGQ
jgi:hypothetical protein